MFFLSRYMGTVLLRQAKRSMSETGCQKMQRYVNCWMGSLTVAVVTFIMPHRNVHWRMLLKIRTLITCINNSYRHKSDFLVVCYSHRPRVLSSWKLYERLSRWNINVFIDATYTSSQYPQIDSVLSVLYLSCATKKFLAVRDYLNSQQVCFSVVWACCLRAKFRSEILIYGRKG